jgi:hypothetical protein
MQLISERDRVTDAPLHEVTKAGEPPQARLLEAAARIGSGQMRLPETLRSRFKLPLCRGGASPDFYRPSRRPSMCARRRAIVSGRPYGVQLQD